jgi:hypothetical protein
MPIVLALSEIAKNVGLLAAALVGIYLAWKRVTASTRQADAALAQAELARRDHVAQLFNRAVGQLDNPKLEVRLGAVYTLRQIAEDFPDIELLSIYLRENEQRYGDSEPPIDVREIMKTVTSRLVVK